MPRLADDDLRAEAKPSGTRGGELDPAAAVLEAIWARHRDETLARVGAVDDAVQDGVSGRADDERRERAVSDAHKLAGSCPTFGFRVAGEIAARLEDALSGSRNPSPDDYRALAGLVRALRRALDGPAAEV